MPGFQRDPDDRAALLVPLLLSHRLRPCRGSRAFEEVRQFLADRELGFVGSYPAVGVGKGIARSGAGPEPVGSPDLCLHLLAGRAASGQRLSLIHISEPTRLGMSSYAVFCLKKKKTQQATMTFKYQTGKIQIKYNTKKDET